MVKIFIFSTILCSFNVMAASSVINIKRNGVLTPTNSTSFLDIYEMCYEGNPWAARRKLNRMLRHDIEKTNGVVWYNQESKIIEIEYVSQKCLDDSLEDEEDEDFSGCGSYADVPQC